MAAVGRGDAGIWFEVGQGEELSRRESYYDVTTHAILAVTASMRHEYYD